MKVGVTGSSGVLGTIVEKKLREKGYEVNSFAGDVIKIEELEDWIKLDKFDVVIHLAAIVPPTEVKESLAKAFEVNSVGTRNLAEILSKESTNTWMFYASTSHVYKSSERPISEEGAIEPISEYGLTKYAGEILAKKVFQNLCIGRIFSMYHVTQKPPYLYANMKNRIQTEDLEKEFELYGAESIRDFLNAEEIADIIILLMEKHATGVFNIASGKGVKIRDFVQGLTDKKLKIKDMGGKDTLVADINKLEKILNEKKVN